MSHPDRIRLPDIVKPSIIRNVGHRSAQSADDMHEAGDPIVHRAMNEHALIFVAGQPFRTCAKAIHRWLHPNDGNHIVIDARICPPAIFIGNLLCRREQVEHRSDTGDICKIVDIGFGHLPTCVNAGCDLPRIRGIKTRASERKLHTTPAYLTFYLLCTLHP